MINPTVPTKPEVNSVPKRIIKINQCPTLSNNSTLTYHIGCDAKGNSVYFCIFSNTGGGFFNDEWIALDDIQTAFDNWPVDQALTSFSLNNLFTGKSANSPAFLMAIIKEEKLVVTLKGKSRAHEYQGSDDFFTETNKLIADGVDLKVEVDTDKKSSKAVKANASVTKSPTRSNKSHRKSA